MTRDEHIAEHKRLHRALDQLAADFFRNTGRDFSTTSIHELAMWSKGQMENPDEPPAQIPDPPPESLRRLREGLDAFNRDRGRIPSHLVAERELEPQRLFTLEQVKAAFWAGHGTWEAFEAQLIPLPTVAFKTGHPRNYDGEPYAPNPNHPIEETGEVLALLKRMTDSLALEVSPRNELVLEGRALLARAGIEVEET